MAWSAFGLASVAVACFGCEFVAQSLWSEAEAEVEDAGGVGDLSMVLTPINLGGTPPVEGGFTGPIFRPREVAARPEVVLAPGAVLEPSGGELGCQFAESLRASLVELTSLALTYVQRMLAGYMDKDSSCKPCRSRGVSLSQVFCHGGKRTSGRVTPRPSGLSRLRSPGRVCSRGTRRPREVPREIVLTLRRLGESPGTALRACRPAAWRTSAAMAKHSRKRETEEPRMSTCSHGRGKPHNLSKEALLEQGEP